MLAVEAPAVLVPDGAPALAVEVVGGGGAGAGVTFGVGRGTDSETYGSSTTLPQCTMCSWLWAAATIRAGVSSCASATSAWRWTLCSAVSWCCREASFTWPLARIACPTTTASKAATTMETDRMVSSLPRLAAVRRPRMLRCVRFGTTRSGGRRVEGASAPRPARRGTALNADATAWRRVETAVAAGGGAISRTRPRTRTQAQRARSPAGARSRTAGWQRPRSATACGRRGRRVGAAPRRRRRKADRGGRRIRR